MWHYGANSHLCSIFDLFSSIGRHPHASVGKQRAPGRPSKPALSSQEHRLACLEERVGGMTQVLEVFTKLLFIIYDLSCKILFGL